MHAYIHANTHMHSVQFSSVAQSCPTLCDPMNCSTPGFPVHHQLPGLLKLMSITSVMPSSHLILCCPLLLLPPIPPSIRVFSNESVLHMKWPKYWSFIHMNAHTCTHTYTHTTHTKHRHIHTHTYTQIHIHTYPHMHMYTHIHTNTNTYMHKYTHAC